MTSDPVLVLLEQSRALTAALDAIEHARHPAEAQRLIRRVAPLVTPDDIVETTAARAMAHIAGTNAPKGSVLPVNLPVEDGGLSDAITTLCLASDAYLAGEKVDVAAVKLIAGTLTAKEAAVHAMAIRFWARAIESVVEGDMREAQRLFRRAYEIASSFGVESQPAIGWLYAAVFLPHAR